MAMENECGLPENPLKMSWVEGQVLFSSVEPERSVPTSSLLKEDESQVCSLYQKM